MTLRTELTDVTLVSEITYCRPMRLWRLMILMEMMLEVLIGVLIMEVDKVADEVTNMEVDKVTNTMAEFATNTRYLAAKFLTNESGATW